MKLIIQIPCFNEENTLAETVSDIPRRIDGIDEVEILIIDDGSTDKTVDVARKIGVDHILQNKTNKGLARSFRDGLDACLRLGADIIVNTDGDNQYVGNEIPKLIGPILRGEADIVVGDRQTESVAHFSPLKKKLQKLGSSMVRRLSGTDIPDAVSGFRAISKEAALNLNIVSSFSYTVEMLIQASRKNMAIMSVPVDTNPKTRESRLFSSMPRFIERTLTTMIRMYAMYQPLRFFFYIGLVLLIIGSLPIIRFLFFYFSGDGGGHVQSLVLGALLIIIGIISFLVGFVADLINFNRHLLEMTLNRVRRLELTRFDLRKAQDDLISPASDQTLVGMEASRAVDEPECH